MFHVKHLTRKDPDMEAPLYLLVRRTPFMVVTAHPELFEDPADAADVVADVLCGYANVTRATAQKDGRDFAKLEVGEIFNHPSRYQFRAVRADFTGNGKPIVPGLRVLNTDMMKGAVCRAQFMSGCADRPGGENFLGWYDVDVDGTGRKSFNGERLTTDGSAFGINVVPRETSLPRDPDDWTGRALGRAQLLDNSPVVRTDGSPG